MLKQRLEHSLALSVRLQRLAERRGLAETTAQLERWQKRRLQETYADFSAQERYRRATRFFTEELYAPSNLSQRDQDLRAMTPSMIRLLPHTAVETVCQAMELQVGTLCLDLRMARELRRRGIDPARMSVQEYGECYRACGRREEREDQLVLLLTVGRALEALVHRPLIYSALKMARWPAQLAGLGELQTFLEHGFEAFRRMHGSATFLSAIERRETALIERLFG